MIAAIARARFFERLAASAATATLAAEPLEIHGEIHAGQGLVEIVDVEQDVPFRGGECPEIHQMAVAASLDRNSGDR